MNSYWNELTRHQNGTQKGIDFRGSKWNKVAKSDEEFNATHFKWFMLLKVFFKSKTESYSTNTDAIRNVIKWWTTKKPYFCYSFHLLSSLIMSSKGDSDWTKIFIFLHLSSLFVAWFIMFTYFWNIEFIMLIEYVKVFW